MMKAKTIKVTQIKGLIGTKQSHRDTIIRALNVKRYYGSGETVTALTVHVS